MSILTPYIPYSRILIVCLFSHPTSHTVKPPYIPYSKTLIVCLFSQPTYLRQILQQSPYVQLRVLGDGIVCLFSHPTYYTVENVLYIYSHTLHPIQKNTYCISILTPYIPAPNPLAIALHAAACHGGKYCMSILTP